MGFGYSGHYLCFGIKNWNLSSCRVQVTNMRLTDKAALFKGRYQILVLKIDTFQKIDPSRLKEARF